ncbi:hypothetical protein CLCR_05568 [Cladophialophora carrionii]|uniref:Uncharacterized protein n=1 Tax=Cladophialophora carrionii TaxID=86049 RepID=A0A1C1C9P1_9EURO|nr:hypothetical protein CLCR_05568 [Cladophialophora carrionii]
MGGRKRSRKDKVPKPDRPLHSLWPEEVIEELIAFLDYAKAEGFQKAQINESAAQHLSLWSHNGRYSPDQIRRKLHLLRHGFGPEDDITGDLDMIYVDGSKNLTWFNEGQEERVAKRTLEIRKEKELEDTYSPRKLRSGSKQITKESRSIQSYHPSAPGKAHRRRFGRGEQSYRHAVSKETLTYEWPFKAEDTPSFDTPVRRTVVTVEIPRPSIAPTVPNSAYTSEETLSPRPDPPDYSDTEDRVFDNREFAAPSMKIRSMTERIECLEKDLHVLRRNSALDVDFWKARCHAVELECVEFKRSQDSLAVKLGELLTTGGKVTIDEVVQLQSTVDKLQSILTSRTEVARLVRPGPRSLDNETALWVAKRMEEAHRDLEKIFATRDADIGWTQVLPHSSNLITPLMHRVIPTGTRSEPEIASAVKVLRSQGITQKQFLQALSAAALVEWVFQASTATLTLDRYHGFCGPGTTSAYFKALAHVASRDLDIHRDIIGEAAFKYFLEIKATDLGSRLQEAFGPLWATQVVADSASETSDVESSLGEQLAGVFTKTMEVQCRLRVSGRRFRYTWYSSGQPIDHDHTTICGQKHRDAEGQSRVSLTLMPGIDEILDETSGVGTSGFVDGCRGLEPGVCLVPAVVLCGNVP